MELVTMPTTNPMDSIAIGDAGILALLGYAVVFFGIILLMVVVMIIGKLFTAKAKKAAAVPAAQPIVAADVAPAADAPKAPGTAGQLMLHDVEPKTAAMIMAIVADKLQKPLNELRFISIKEVK